MGKTNKPAPKTLGQIAHEAGEKHDGWARRWSDCSESQKMAWELIAADVVRAAFKPLTDDQLSLMAAACLDRIDDGDYFEIARAVEAKHGITGDAG